MHDATGDRLNGRGHVGPIARTLGFAGLLPQVAAVGWMLLGEPDAFVLAATYALAILSFLGGMWWSFAMRSEGRQPIWATVAVLPSLAAVALAALMVASGGSGWALVATGAAIMLTLVADRALVAAGLTPEGWMALRVPLSIGLGGLTITAGVLVGT